LLYPVPSSSLLSFPPIATEQLMIDWFVETLRAYPPLAVFLALGIGFCAGSAGIGQLPGPL
jgi:hypothetical protein